MKPLRLLLLLLLLPSQALQAQSAFRVEVIAQAINVRAAPGGSIIGILYRGALVDVSEVSQGGAWLGFTYWDRPGWITSDSRYVLRLDGRASGAVTIQQYSIIPDIPEPGAPFVVRVTIQAAQEMSQVRIALTCAEFAMVDLPRLGTVAQTVDLHCPGDPVTGAHTSALVIEAGSGSSTPITYFVDRAYEQSTIDWPDYSDLNLDGESFDLSYDGQSVRALNGGLLYNLPGLESLALVHFDRCQSQSEPVSVMPGKGLIGLLTPEGNRGVIQFLTRQGTSARITFRIYGGSHAGTL